ncbi:MAG: methylmalonyl Co-A mutase-associated GTPase MeaB [Bacillota bacterium]|nr:methylmalonyl Co-A mutase-associated GTPase MeaB [Bacillota bacterium]
MLEIVQKLLAGDRRALSRAMSLVEDEEPEARQIMREVHPESGKAHVIGVTGPPGVGKSTLVDALAAEYRRTGATVGIVAVDPSSPFTGGALLGDRIRMQRHTLDPGVFVRSLATRGKTGGISAATGAVAKLLDASGRDIVIIETVGAGQSEVEIMKHVASVIVVMAPGLGDDIQAIKAGILEIADVFVVNKADLDGAARTARDLESALDLRAAAAWVPPVLLTVSRSGEGVKELREKLEEHLAFLKREGGWEQRLARSARAEMEDILARKLVREVGGGDSWQRAQDHVKAVAAREMDPYTAADELVQAYLERMGAGRGRDR